MAGPRHQPGSEPDSERILELGFPELNALCVAVPALLGSECWHPPLPRPPQWQAASMAEKPDLHRGPAGVGFWLSPRQSVAARRRGLGVPSKAETEPFWSV